MSTEFKSEYSLSALFYARGDLLRPKFGAWDCCDPVAHVILDVVEAQNELADLFADEAEFCNFDSDDAPYRAALQKRHAAGKRLMRTLLTEGKA
jgi:hypothetical protein